jgi:stalled ribosome rescue protein Dom34
MPISRRKPETNVQLVKRLMEFSKYGALSQLFIIDALLKQSEAVSRSTLTDYP